MKKQRKRYITIESVIRIFETTPELQDWVTYEETVARLKTRLPDTENHILYGLCKRCRQSDYFDSVQLQGVWYIKYIG